MPTRVEKRVVFFVCWNLDSIKVREKCSYNEKNCENIRDREVLVFFYGFFQRKYESAEQHSYADEVEEQTDFTLFI